MTNRIKNWLFIGVFLFICIGLCLYNKQLLMIHYHNLKNNHYTVNDHVYMKDKLINIPGYNMTLYRFIKPINGDGEPCLIFSTWSISADSLRNKKTALLGSYLKHDVLKVKVGKQYFPLNFYAIKVYQKMLVKTGTTSFNEIPQGYIDTEGPFYVIADLTQNSSPQITVKH